MVFIEDQLTERLKQELGLADNQIDNEQLYECRKEILEQYSKNLSQLPAQPQFGSEAVSPTLKMADSIENRKPKTEG